MHQSNFNPDPNPLTLTLARPPPLTRALALALTLTFKLHPNQVDAHRAGRTPRGALRRDARRGTGGTGGRAAGVHCLVRVRVRVRVRSRCRSAPKSKPNPKPEPNPNPTPNQECTAAHWLAQFGDGQPLTQTLDDPCSICLEEMQKSELVLALQCGHLYHATCVRAWLGRRQWCPLCKAPAL